MSRRSLWPREHGAYFQLGIPLVAACVTASPTVASVLLVLASSLAFLAHEPLLVVLGNRGKRVATDAARRRLVLLGGVAIPVGVTGLALAPTGAVAVAAAVAVIGAIVLELARRRREHTLGGELVAVAGLTGASVPVAVAAGAPIASAAGSWIGWTVGFGATVIAVHRVMARHKRTARPIDHVLAISCGAATVVSIAIGSVVAAPLLAIATALIALPPPASKLRAIGIAIAIVATASAVLAGFGG